MAYFLRTPRAINKWDSPASITVGALLQSLRSQLPPSTLILSTQLHPQVRVHSKDGLAQVLDAVQAIVGHHPLPAASTAATGSKEG